jgi:hypothetical protein
VKRILFSICVAGSTALAQPPSEIPPTDAPVEAAPEAAPVEAAPAAPVDAAPVAAEPAATDDIDLSALGLDPSAVTFDDKLNIYGFADFSYTVMRFDSPLVADDDKFAVGNVNLFVRKNLTQRWRSLMEVRLLFAPNGALNLDGSQSHVTTAVADSANFERGISWGGISIERVYVEYDITPYLTLRAGHFLTPYGIWNIDHGAPTIIGTSRPYIIGEQLFPEHQTGLEAYGAKAFDDYRLEYHATLSNGRNPFEATRDPDRSPAIGGRLALTTPWIGETKIGASAYRGRAFEGTGPADAVMYDETALGLDIAVDHSSGFHAQGELLYQAREYRTGQRAARGTAGFVPDGFAYGFYALAGYRFSSLWNVMPYVIYEHYEPFDETYIGPAIDAPSVGLNFRPIPTLVLKAQGTWVDLQPGGGVEGAIAFFNLQSAWVF